MSARMEMRKEPEYTGVIFKANGLYRRFKVLLLKTTPLFFIVLSLAISLVLSSAYAKTSVGFILASKGEVYLYHKDELVGVDVVVQEPVYPGDLIVTTERSGSKIRLKDESVLNIGENSRLKIKEYLLFEEEQRRVALFKLFSGKLRARLSEGYGAEGSSFKIETPLAIAEAREADFIISMTEKGTEIAAISGVVHVRSTSPSIPGEVVLNAGFGITVKQGWVLPEPARVPEERLTTVIEEMHVPLIVPPDEEKVAGCVTCHQRTYATMVKQKFIHPAAQRDCKRCHIKQVEKVREIPAEVYAKESLIFFDVEEKTSSIVRVRVKDRAGREALSGQLTFTASTLTKEMINDNKPPLISNLRVEELSGGVFYSAVLAWDTDKPCTSGVEYGLPGAPPTRFAMGGQYTKDHRLTVGGLKEGREYVLRVTSKDPFGNFARSEDLRVETVRPFSMVTDGPDVFPSVEEVSVLNVDGKTALSWKTNVETVAVVDLSTSIVAGPSNDPHSPGFAELKYRGLYGCLTEDCHKGRIHKALSHPTGTLSWEKVNPPLDLPLLDGSVMLCITCHTPHGGKHNYRLRKAELELCTSCHLAKK